MRPKTEDTVGTTRRDFLRVGGSAMGALFIGIPAAMAAPLRRLDASHLSESSFDEHGAAKDAVIADALGSQYLRLDADGTVTIVVARSEMGQGVRTSLPMIVAEELGADWQKVRVVQASPSATFTGLVTGGSESVSSMWQPLRKAGAAAREMLISAAATQLGVSRDGLQVEGGVVTHTESQQRIPIGDLVATAAALPVPQDPPMRDPMHYRIIGTPRRRVDGNAIVHGRATYGLDVRVPGMKFAAIAMPPVAGASHVSHNVVAAKAVHGVRDVIMIPAGVAVIADSTWAAFKGRDALAVVWKDGANGTFDSQAYRAKLRERTKTPGDMEARGIGDASAALAAAPPSQRLDAVYEFPFQAHATMEPQNCTARVSAIGCELWVGSQAPDAVQADVARALQLPVEKITVNIPLLGGGFGRRIQQTHAVDAALLAQRAGVPVQVVWSRADDFSHDLYQPMFVSRLSAALGPNNMPIAWQHRVASSAVTGSVGGKVSMEAESLGARDVPYAMPNVRVEYTHVPTPMTMGWWRAVLFVPNVYARECFIDELATKAGIDPIEYRMRMLDETSLRDLQPKDAVAGASGVFNVDRLRRVLHTVANKSGWMLKTPKGIGRGVACLSYDDRSYCAQVAEVEVVNGRVKVRKIVTALDVGRVINPLGITGQVESAVLWGVTAALRGDMRFARGRASRTTFAEYQVATLTDTPAIETYLMPPDYPPSGAGEPPVPAVAPAIINAIYAATGKRLRSLPVDPAALLG